MKKRVRIYYILLIFFLCTFCISGWKVADYYVQSEKNKTQYQQLASSVQQPEAIEGELPQEVPKETILQNPEEKTVKPAEMLPEYREIYEKNQDLVGWLSVPGTEIDLPVVQRPNDDSYYLNHDFFGNQSQYGCPFAWSAGDVQKPSDNITVFGHHMRDGSMFAGLDSYVDKTHWEQYPVIQFNNLYGRYFYRIFAVFITSATPNKGFAYHRFVEAADAEEFQTFISNCKKISLYDTGITPQYGDKILCLSTCEYTKENGRLVVAAVRIEP